MLITDDFEIKKLISNCQKGVYLFYGEEAYLKKFYLDKLVRVSYDDSFADFNYVVIDGKDCNVTDIIESCESFPMMSDSKCVLVDDFDISVIKDNFDIFEDFLSDFPDYCVLIFNCISFTKSSDFNKLTKLIDKTGYCVEFNKKTNSEIKKILESGAKKRNKEFCPGSAEYLINCVGNDLTLLSNELNKLCSYCDVKISNTDIDELCTKSLDVKTFRMINDLIAGNFDSAMSQLSLLFQQRENEQMILGAIISQYSNLYRIKATVSEGLTVKELCDSYSSYTRPDILSKSVKQAQSLSFEQLNDCLDILSDADLTLKTSSESASIILEKTMIKLARAGKR